MTTDGLTINGVSFGWTEIGRVGYHASDIYVNGAYMGAVFVIRVGTAAATAVFRLDSRTTGAVKINRNYEQRDHHQAQWTKAVNILEEKVCGRLISAAVATVQRGGTANISGLRIDPHGVHKGRLFSKSLAWQDFAGTDKRNEYFVVLAHRDGKEKPAIKVPVNGWNGVLIPRIITELASNVGRQH
ncbi:hypothetical protein ACQEUX_02870 [Micromonospora sp. CA-259024]|uniref:hypothetical protein n=1 Tax=Micromonospora sp. CA-259024 TaxID=3239965 RepID=UPI003D92C595